MTEDEKSIALKLGVALRNLRTAQGWTQQQLADQADVAQAYIAYIERGHRSPSFSLVATFARLFEVDASFFFGELPGLTDADLAMLVRFRRLTPDMQKRAIGVLSALSA